MLTGAVVLILFLFAILPTVLSLWQLYCLDRLGDTSPFGLDRRRSPQRFSPVRHPTALRGISRQSSAIAEFRYLDGIGYFIGDLSCEFNARSPHIRCAVNPEGPCQGCRAYQAKDPSPRLR
jgi:hypothetical protein